MADMDDEIGEVPQEHDMNGDNDKKIVKLLQKVINGMPLQSETAFRKLIDNAVEFGVGPLFNRILPLFKEHTLEERQKCRLVKLTNRILYKLNNLVQPYVTEILVVIKPLLINDDYYVRLEGGDIISNLSKVAGRDSMIDAMSPDIFNMDENVRSTTARAFSFVAYTLGIPALLPFLKNVCQNLESWETRHTGIKIVHQIAILFGSSVLPHLGDLVKIIKHGLNDENHKVMTITALSLAALAKATAPSGIECFNAVLEPLWAGIKHPSGKVLAAFLKSIGYIVPLMGALNANNYTNKVMPFLIRELQSPSEDIKKIVLNVIKQCVSTEGVEVVPKFVEEFWDIGMALDKRNNKQFVGTIFEMVKKVGFDSIAQRIVENLSNKSESHRQLAMETIEKMASHFQLCDINRDVLIHGILYAFKEQTSDDGMMLTGFGTVVTSLGKGVKSYFPQICDTLNERLSSQNEKVRKQSADLISRIAVVMKQCEMVQQLSDFCTRFFNRLEIESEEVLDSFLEAMNSIIDAIGLESTTLPMDYFVDRLNGLLDNRSFKVQEVCIKLVNRIATDTVESVSKENWMNISLKICEKFVEPKKLIRTAAVNTFGTLIKVEAVRPHTILPTPLPTIMPILMDNLVARDGRVRVSSTVAIAIIAEVYSPAPVLETLIKKYNFPNHDLRCGVLKSLAFLFEYITDLKRGYMYAVTPVLEHALRDINMERRYLGICAVKHITLKAAGMGHNDLLLHLLNNVWSNIVEYDSQLLINVAVEVIEAMRVALGSQVILNYCVQGLFHPAKRVREIYWKIYNLVFIADQDALVAFYPSFDGLVRAELHMFV